MTIRSLIHLNLSPAFMLGEMEFGGIELVPDECFARWNQDCGGDEDKYHVIKITDLDGNTFLITSYEEAEIVF